MTVLEPVIWKKTDTGFQKVVVTLPTHWQGECDCIVGPFSSREVATHFANYVVVGFAQFETLDTSIFANGDAWYLEVKTTTPVHGILGLMQVTKSEVK
jgi:hypothetical protein